MRSYRPAFSAEVAAAMMKGGHGVQFDPDILAVFLDSLEDLLGTQAIAVNI